MVILAFVFIELVFYSVVAVVFSGSDMCVGCMVPSIECICKLVGGREIEVS